jgi:hypothetical protein
MALDQLLTNTVLLLLFIGIPVIPLLFIATELGRWYREHPDPEGVGLEDAPDHAAH